jgi:hypothetical protein
LSTRRIRAPGGPSQGARRTERDNLPQPAITRAVDRLTQPQHDAGLRVLIEQSRRQPSTVTRPDAPLRVDEKLPHTNTTHPPSAPGGATHPRLDPPAPDRPTKVERPEVRWIRQNHEHALENGSHISKRAARPAGADHQTDRQRPAVKGTARPRRPGDLHLQPLSEMVFVC